MNEIFTTVTLPMGGSASIFEGKGKHYFSAASKAKDDSSLILKYLILELVQIKGKNLTEPELDEMHLRDVAYLFTVVNTMLSDNFGF